MTATLTPAPIFEDMAIRDLEEHYDDEVVCVRGDAPATVRLIMRCCQFVVLTCDEHHARNLIAMSRLLERGGLRCRVCFHEWCAPETVDDVVRVVTL